MCDRNYWFRTEDKLDVEQEVDNWHIWIRYATCRTPSRSTIPSLKWLWYMVVEIKETDNIGNGRKDRRKDGQS